MELPSRFDVTPGIHADRVDGPRLESLPERTMAWAWDVPGRDMVRIHLGEADTLRQRARSGELICPLGQCPHPELTTRSHYVNRWGTSVPDGFRHLVHGAGMHEPESVSHVAAKLMMADWLVGNGMRNVHVERYDTQAQRTPDVTATHPSGQRFAVEVQYSDLPVELWKERDRDLRSAGLLPIWVWGHSRREVTSDGTGARLLAIHRTLLREGSQLWWINPEVGALALAGAQRPTADGARVLVCPELGDDSVGLCWWPLPGFAIGTDGIEHPELDRLMAQLASLRRHHLGDLHAGLASLVSSIDRRQNEVASASLVELEQADRLQPLYKPAGNDVVSVAVEVCDVTEEQHLQLRMNGLGPTIDTVYPGDMEVWMPQQRWHAWVVCRLLDGRTPGTTVRIGGIVNTLAPRVPHDNRPGRLRGAVTDLLRAVEKAGFIRVDCDWAIIVRELGTVPKTPAGLGTDGSVGPRAGPY